MIDLIVRFMTFRASNVIPSCYYALGFFWIMLVLAGVWSIKSQRMAWQAKMGWFLLILCVPLIGLAIYAAYCLVHADSPILRHLGIFRRRSRI